MGLETATYIGQLNPANPTGTDPKGQGDDHLRMIKSTLTLSFAGFGASPVLVTGTDTGAANAYVLTPSPALSAYVEGMNVIFVPSNGSTGACTLNISGLGVRGLKSVSGVDLVNGEIATGQTFVARYTGAEFRLIYVTKQYTDQLAFGGSLPSQSGNAGKVIGTDGTNASWVFAGINGRRSIVGADTIVAADTEKLLQCAGTFSLAITAAATLGDQFGTYVANTGSGLVTLDPNGSELIDGATTKVLPPGAWCLIFTDGAAFFTIGAAPNLFRSTRTANTALVSGDGGTYVDVTSGSFTQTASAAATLGNGWNCYFGNSGTGTVTIDPNGSETIGGQATLTVYPGEIYLLQCDGSNLNVVAVKTDLGPHLVVRDVKPATVAGGAAIVATWTERTLNTVVTNIIPGASLASSRITLPAGAWRVEVRSFFFATNFVQLRLRNVTDSTTLAIGPGRQMYSSGSDGGGFCTISERIVLAAPKVLSLEYYAESTSSSFNLGWPTNTGEVGIFTEVEITRLY